MPLFPVLKGPPISGLRLTSQHRKFSLAECHDGTMLSDVVVVFPDDLHSLYPCCRGFGRELRLYR